MAQNELINLIINVVKRGDPVLRNLAKEFGDLEKAEERLVQRNEQLKKSYNEQNKALTDNERAARAHEGQIKRLTAQQERQIASNRKLQTALQDEERVKRSGLATDRDRERAALRAERAQAQSVRNYESINRAERERMQHVHGLHSAISDLEDTENRHNIALIRLNRTQRDNNRDTNEGKRAIDLIRQEWSQGANDASKLERRLARLGRALQGLAAAGALIFLQSLNSAIVGLAGSAISMAGSLVYAAGALGGVFIAAIGQAIPLVGLLAATMQRLQIVTQAVTQANLVQKQSGRRDTQDAQQAASAADSLASAQEGVVNAHQAVTDAQRSLTEARREARRELEDLILAEQRATLTQRDSAAALKDALQSGDIGAVQQAQLDSIEARHGTVRARQDLANARQGGPGSPQDRVIAAQRALDDANRQVASSTRAVAAAQREATQAASGQSAAENNLAFFMSQLDPAEKRLVHTIVNFQQQAKKLLAPITDNIINSFTFGIKQVEHLVAAPGILNGLKRLSSGVGGVFEDMTKFFTSDKNMRFFELMMKELSHNLGPIEKILKNIFVIFRNIATAAAPVLHKFLKLVADETGRWAKQTGNLKGLTDFFFTSLRHLRAWYGLLKSIVRLFAALMGVSGPSALKTLNDLTENINKAADAINQNPKDGKNFFDKAAESTSYLGDVLVALGKAMFHAFNPKSTKAFRDILVDAIIPGLALGIELTGKLAKILDWFITNFPLGDKIIQLGIGLTVFASAVSLLSKLLGGLLRPLGAAIDGLGQYFGIWKDSDSVMRKAWNGMRFVMNKLGTLAQAGVEAATNFIGGFATKIKGSKGGQIIGAALRKAYTRVALWAEMGIAAAGNFLDSFMTFMRTKVRPRIKTLGRGWGVLIAAGIVVGIVLALEDPKFRRQVKNAFAVLVAFFADLWQDALNAVIGLINTLITKFNSLPGPNIGTLGTFDWKQKERDKVAAGQGSNFSDKTIGIDAGPTISDKRRQQMIQNSATQHLFDIADPNSDATSKVRKQALKELKDLNAQGKLNTQQQAQLAQATKQAANQTDNLSNSAKTAGKRLKDTKDQLDSTRTGAKKAGQGVGTLGDTMAGVAGDAHNMADQFGKATNKVLISFGAKKIAYTLPAVIPPHARPLGGTFAQGGYFGDPNQRTRDDRLIGVAGGEAILTGHQQRAVNMALAYSKAAGAVPYSSLNDLFSRDKREHRTAPPAFAKGGYVWRGVGPSGLHPGIKQATELVLQQFPGLSVTSTIGGNHVSGSYHYKGEATDISGSTDTMHTASSWIKRSGLYKSLAEGIHNPNLSVSDGSIVSPSFYSGVWAGHADHIHLAVAGALKGLIAGAAAAAMPTELKRALIKGPNGPLKNALQGQSDALRKAANKLIGKKAGGVGSKAALGADTNLRGQLSRNEVAAIAREALTITHAGASKSHISDLVWLANAESGYNANSINLTDSNAAAGNPSIGLMQTTGSTFNAYALPGHKDIRNPLDNMIASIRYQLARYGHIIRFSPYAKGGIVPEFDTGGVVPGPLGMPVMAKVHGGETILPTHKIDGFQTGGIANPEKQLEDSLKSLAKSPSQIRKISKSKFTKLINALNELTREDGIFDDISNSIEALTNILATRLTQWSLKMRNGIVAQIRTNIEVANQTLANLQNIYNDLSNEFVDVNKTIKALKTRIKKTKDKEKKKKLKVVLDGLNERAQEVADALAQQLQDILDAQSAAWQAVLDNFDRRLGDLDLLNQILELQGAISGTPDAAGMKNILQQKAGVLTEERAAIQAQLAQAIAVGDTERANQLQTALLENQLALLQNTQAIKELDGTMGQAQTFNTTSWQLFRQAVLNGTNGLLPQFASQIPSLQTGGQVISGGLVNLHAGEVVHDKNAGPVEQHYHFTEPMEVADPTVIGAQIAWKWKQQKV